MSELLSRFLLFEGIVFFLLGAVLVCSRFFIQPVDRIRLTQFGFGLVAVALFGVCIGPQWSIPLPFPHLVGTPRPPQQKTETINIVETKTLPPPVLPHRSDPVIPISFELPAIETDNIVTRCAAKTQAGFRSHATIGVGVSLGLPLLFLFARDWSAFRRLRRLLRNSAPAPEFVEILFREISVNTTYLRMSKEIVAPIVFGYFRPTLLLPSHLAGTSRPELRACLAHEWAHLKNGDLTTWNIVRLSQYPLWMQPFYWMLRTRLLADQDYLADDEGVRACSEPIDYAQILLDLAKNRYNAEPRTALGMAAPPTQLRRRIEMLLDRSHSLSRKTNLRKLFLPLLLLTVLTLLGGTLRIQTVAQEPSWPAQEPGVSTPGLVESKPIVVHPRATVSMTTPPALYAAKLPVREREIYALLEEPFSCDFKEPITLGKALQHISKTTGIEIDVDHPALREIDVTTEKPVKFQLPFGLRLRDALDYLLKQHGLTWTINNEMLSITTPNRAQGEYYPKTYYVGDLLHAIPIPPQKHDESPNKAAAPNFGAETQRVDFTPLMDYIRTMVSPDSWKNGGEIMEYYPNLSLVIKQRETEHADIVELLKRLRKMNGIQITFECKNLTSMASDPKTPRVTGLNGMEIRMQTTQQSDDLLRIAPVSSKPVPEKLAAANKPFMVQIPKGTTSITLKGVAGKKDGQDVIKATVTVEGREPETRTFYASPLVQEEEEEYLTGTRHQIFSQPGFVTVNAREIYEKLEKPVSLNVDKPKPLGDVLKMLRNQTGIEMFIDHLALREVDVTINTPVSIQLMKETRLESVLNLILGQLNLGYVVKDDTIHITSAAKAKRQLYTVTYAVAGLSKDKSQKSLMELVEAVVSPDSWQEGGTMKADDNGNLVIVQKEEVHAELVELFEKVREMNELKIGVLVDFAPFDAPAKDEHGEIRWERIKEMLYNGQTFTPKLDGGKKLLVRVQADSSSPVAPELAAKNEPIFLVVPAGKKLEVRGVASQDRQFVRLTTSVAGSKPLDRNFHAKAFESKPVSK